MSRDFCSLLRFLFFFFFTDTATTEIYTLSLHDALPISGTLRARSRRLGPAARAGGDRGLAPRSEEHTSELQSHHDLVCRLLLEKKKKKDQARTPELSEYGKNRQSHRMSGLLEHCRTAVT